MWLLSVLTTEWGYFLSLVVVALGYIVSLIFDSYFYFFIGLLGAFAYLLPFYFALKLAPLIKNGLQDSFGGLDQYPDFHISLKKLLIGEKLPDITPVSYIYSSEFNLTLDLYRGKNNSGHKMPCVIIVHGGAWDSGNSKQLPELNKYLAAKGYIVAAINYRLSPQYTFPAPVEDLAKAIEFLKLNSDIYGIDADNLFLLGRSAGGQIVQVAGYQLNDRAIKGVVAFYAPADLVWGYANPCSKWVMDSKKVQEYYLGGTYEQRTSFYHSATVSEVIKKSGPPMLMLHGRHDVLVGFIHNTRLIPYLEKYKIAHYLLDMRWAVHGFDYHFNGLGGQMSTYAIEYFLKKFSSE